MWVEGLGYEMLDFKLSRLRLMLEGTSTSRHNNVRNYVEYLTSNDLSRSPLQSPLKNSSLRTVNLVK
jgi:hypothetical protein